MPLNSQFVKSHWMVLAGGLGGLLLLIYLFKHGSSSAASSSTTPDLSGGANVNQNLQAAATLSNGAVDASVQIAAYQASAVNNSTLANLQANLADTAAKLAVANQSTSANLAVNLDKDATAISIQRLQSDQAIKTTAIQGQTLTNLAVTQQNTTLGVAQAKQNIDLAQIGLQTHIYDTLASQKKLGGSSEGVAKIVASIYGQGPAAIAASQPSAVASSPGAILNGVAGIASALFG